MKKSFFLLPAFLECLFFLPRTSATPLVQNVESRGVKVDLKFDFASIGDSWAAGQAVTKENAYGGPSNWDLFTSVPNRQPKPAGSASSSGSRLKLFQERHKIRILIISIK